jgi:hypothetical protein
MVALQKAAEEKGAGWFKPSFVVCKKFEMINESLEERVERMSMVYTYIYIFLNVVYMI